MCREGGLRTKGTGELGKATVDEEERDESGKNTGDKELIHNKQGHNITTQQR